MKQFWTWMMVILATLTLLGCSPRQQNIASAPELADPIKTEYGLVSGSPVREGSDVRIYKGIPYAAPPVGSLRWKPPQPPSSWIGVRECTSYSIAAPQKNPFGTSDFTQSEDCLYVNVLTPAKTAADKLPVMVWMHGGGYAFGTGNDPAYNLPGLPKHGVVLVTVNMRLNLLGLLAHPLLSRESPDGVSGNYLFLDMIAALKWVRGNIATFGGDPSNVTIFGESGGGAKVSTLMASPLATGLFHRAILESGTATEGFTPGISMEDAEELGRKVFAMLGVDKEADPLATARALPWETVLAARVPEQLDAAVDGWFLEDTAANIFRDGKQNPVPFITVANLGEITGPGIPTFIFPTLIPGYTNMLANAPKAGVAGYAAIFEHVPAVWKADGVVPPHAMELPYVFGEMNSRADLWTLIGVVAMANGKDPGLSDEDRQLSENIMKLWTQFARNGNPNVPGLVEWPAYDAASDKYIVLDTHLAVKSGFSLITPKQSLNLTPSTTPVPTLTASPAPTSGTSVTGTLERTGRVPEGNAVTENGKWIGKATDSYIFHGILEGEMVQKTVREVGVANGMMTGTAEGTFTGTLNGKKGTFTFTGVGNGQFFSTSFGGITYKLTIVGGTNELSGLHGTLVMSIDVRANGDKGTYSGTLSFEP